MARLSSSLLVQPAQPGGGVLYRVGAFQFAKWQVECQLMF